MSESLPARALERLLAIGAEPPGPADASGRYRILREIGRGGMGVVYEAEDSQLGRRVALKVLAEGAGGPELRLRFAHEAIAAARLTHPHVAAVYDVTPDFIAMQLIDGLPLSLLPRADVRRLVRLVRDAARAVHYAHGQGVIHRDLKPSNLLVAGDHVFVMDFGLAKQAGLDTALSGSGRILGTPHFMPPEQAQGRLRDVDERSDVYALGATLYACVTGRPPFDGPEALQVLRRVAEEEPKPPRVERDLDTVLLKCLAKEREMRYPTAAALADDLDRWLLGEPVVARRPSAIYRLRKRAARHRALLTAAALAVVVTAAALGPIAIRNRAALQGASEALALSSRVASILADAETIRRQNAMGDANRVLDRGVVECDAFLERHDVARVHQMKSRLLRARGKREAAVAALDRAIALEPGLPGARFERGLLLADEDPERALADLSSDVPDGTGLRSVDLEFGRAELARLRKDYETARGILEEVRRRDPTHVQALLSLARVALAQGDDEKARECALSAVALQRGLGGR